MADRKVNHDRLGLGARRGITVTVTTTPSSLADLLDAASSGRIEMTNRRQLNLQNTSGSTIFILENASQTVSEGVQVAASGERQYEMSTTGTGNNLVGDDISGTFFAVASGTASMVVEELA